VACWRTKPEISPKRVKTEEKLQWRAYMKSPTLFRTVPSTPPFPKIGDSQPHAKTAITSISGTDKATDCKFGRYIYRVHANKSPLEIWKKMERGRIQGLPNFFPVPFIISGTGKATNFQFCTHILSIDWNKSPLQISGKVAGCVVRTLETFPGTHILGA